MGLVIGLILSAAVFGTILIIEFYDRKRKIERERVIDITMSIIELISAIIFTVLFIAFFMTGPTKNEKYSKETLVETIELQEIEENIYINYSYSTKEYSYVLDNEVKIISEDCLVKEVKSNIDSPQLVHYELSEPENFWISHLPWMKLDKYIIYVPDREMIGRTN